MIYFIGNLFADEGGGYMSTYEVLTLIFLASNLLISILQFRHGSDHWFRLLCGSEQIHQKREEVFFLKSSALQHFSQLSHIFHPTQISAPEQPFGIFLQANKTSLLDMWRKNHAFWWFHKLLIFWIHPHVILSRFNLLYIQADFCTLRITGMVVPASSITM